MKEQGGIAPFNLANQSRIIRGRMPLLEIIHDKFSRELTSRLSESLGFRVEVNPISIDWSKFDSFMRSLPVPTAISLMTMEPLNGKFLHVLDARSVCALVEKLLGGDEPQRLEGREFTSLEQHLLEINMLPYIIDILQDSWAMLSHFDIKHEEMVKHPPFACIVEPSEAVIVITFEIEIDNAIGSLTLLKSKHPIKISSGKPLDFRQLIANILREPWDCSGSPALLTLPLLNHTPNIPIKGQQFNIDGHRCPKLPLADTVCNLFQ